MPAVLGYWKIRGIAQPIRLLLHYVGEDFEDKYYECGPAPDFNRDKWLNEKYTLSLPFPNLPYYIDGDIKITQSNAILRHIARKYDMCGKTEKDMVRVDMLADQTMDLRNGLNRLVYNPRFKLQNEIYATYMKELPRKLKELDDFLGDNKFFVGNEPTFPDFAIYELLDQHRIMDPNCMDSFKKLKSFLDRFESLEPIKRYMQLDKFLARPLNNKMAKFGGD